MKEINIKIRYDDESGNFGFALDRSQKDFNSGTETLKLIGALNVLIKREQDRLERIKTFKVER